MSLILGLIPPHAAGLRPLLPVEMAAQARRAAGEAIRFEVLVVDRACPTALSDAAIALGMRIDRWHVLSSDPDDCRIACDWAVARHAASAADLWPAAGPTDALRAVAALDRRLPTEIATRLPIACMPAIWQGAPRWPVRAWPGDATPRTGRHAAGPWLSARGAVGQRLLALWTATYAMPTRAADFANLDGTIRRLARVLIQARSAARPPTAETCHGWIEALRAGRMLTVLARWLNAAERALEAKTPIDLTLPTVLGLIDARRLQVIP